MKGLNKEAAEMIFDKHKYFDEVVKTHMLLSGLINIKNTISGCDKFDEAIAKNLKQIGLHAGEKRFWMGEIYMPMDLLAICQYEYMLKQTREYATDKLITMVMDLCLKQIEKLRGLFKLESFEQDNLTVVIVEGKRPDGTLVALTIEEFTKWKGKFERMLPTNKDWIFHKPNCEQFLNWNGNEEKAIRGVNYVAKMLAKEE